MPLTLSEVEHRMKMVFEKNRLATFTSWHFNDKSKCNAKKVSTTYIIHILLIMITLAEAGFYYVGTANEQDEVQCFICCTVFQKWNKNDDPWQEHIALSEECEFAKLATPEQMLTLNQFDQLFRNSIKKHCTQYIEGLLEHKKKLCAQQCEILRNIVNDKKE
ncbi:hypothetical protein RI129_003973 [Pyrocoelia pectoralis]|uniref:Baculoviral IAP repeat-containing protein 5 n=1 Tax=Pyrocoelia pectoralis TaxID=417401 RepID=A0AAN7VRI2_9COLE